MKKTYSNIQVYLQGENALELDWTRPNTKQRADYLLGGLESAVHITDRRSKPCDMLFEILFSGDVRSFTPAFNSPANAEVQFLDDESIQITLSEPSSFDNEEILWLGVTDGTLPAHEVDWEIFKSLHDGRIAFVALVL